MGVDKGWLRGLKSVFSPVNSNTGYASNTVTTIIVIRYRPQLALYVESKEMQNIFPVSPVAP